MGPDLELVPTLDLLEELKRRHVTMLWVGLDNKDYIQLYKGGFGVHCIGLAEYARRRIYEQIGHDEETDGEPPV